MASSSSKKDSVGLTAEKKLKLFDICLTSRHCDLREQSLLRQNKGWFHISSMGHEGVAALAPHFGEDDYFAPYYRDRALMIGLGVTPYDMALSFLAKKESSSGGRQLTGHFSSSERRIFSHGSPVASHLLPACGIAWGLKLDKRPGVVFASVGEAGSRQGDFYEAFCIAREHNLSVLFVVEDNRIAISTGNAKTNPLALGVFDEALWTRIDGSDFDALDRFGAEVLPKMRAGGGPHALWLDTVRVSSHSSADDQRLYLCAKELARLTENDPVPALRRMILKDGIKTEAELDAIEEKIREKVREAYRKAEKAADPRAEDTTLHIKAKPTLSTFPQVPTGGKKRMVEAINEVFHLALEDKDTVFFGQDIADPKGGVFKLTNGLSTKAPDRVVNAPVAESTIIGMACGLAAYGKRPVFEIQFIDFLAPAWNQLVSNVATLRWRSYGDWECPAVIYAPCGAYLPGGAIWHSQSGEATLASVPGLTLAMPSNGHDAAAVFWTAMQMRDPVVILVPKHSLWTERPFPENPSPAPAGRARLLRQGDDVTIVTWGNCVELVEEACEKLGLKNEAEIFDLLWLSPWDKQAITDSVQRTGRLLVVQEEVRDASVGQMIIAELSEDPSIWQALRAAPVLISRDNVNIGLNPAYEYAALPDVATVQDTIARLLRRDHTRAAQPALLQEAVSSVVSGERRQVIRVPILGEGISQARVIGILKQTGDAVEPDDGLCEIETDKAVFPIEASHKGTLVEWLIEDGAEIQVGQIIAHLLLAEGEEASELVDDGENSPAETSVPPASAPRKIVAFDAPAPAPLSRDEGARERSSGLSAEIIRQMQGLVPATITLKARWDKIKEARAKAKAKLGPEAPTPSAMIAWCTVQAMKNHKSFTSTITMDRVRKTEGAFDIGVAVSLPHDELVTAIVSEVNELDWETFRQRFVESVGRARARQFEPKTRVPVQISTMGPFDVRSAIPIVVPPSIATLFVGGAHYEPNPGDGSVDQRQVVNLTLTFDHRWINGVGAASFLSEVRERLETFSLPGI
jgi:2-oxoisovalerate dehydrogenase E1 component